MNLSYGADIAWQIAAKEADKGGFQLIEQEHLLIGICSLEKIQFEHAENIESSMDIDNSIHHEREVIKEAFHRLGLDPVKLRRILRRKMGKNILGIKNKAIHRSPICKRVFTRASTFTVSNTLTCLELSLAILEQSSPVIVDSLDELGVEYEKVFLDIRSILDENKNRISPSRRAGTQIVEKKFTADQTSYLRMFGRDLTDEAKKGKLGPFVGRQKELLLLLQILARQNKNNPILVGEPGVGKTAIVESLASYIFRGDIPKILKNKRIIEINIGVLLAGTKYRGEFEERITSIIDEVKADASIILFIDEIHSLVGSGRSEGNSLDAANIMKSSLARGEIRCIGSTTTSEYRKYIESDSAFERRFEKIIIEEPTPEEAIEILIGLRNKLEAHHQVRISEEAIRVSVYLSSRFDIDHNLPDKAIDLIDIAGSKMHVPLLTHDHASIDIANESMENEIKASTIAQIVSEKFRLPHELVASYIGGFTKSQISQLEGFLKSKIVGQDDAIRKVSNRLLVAYTNLTERKGPIASFLFMGPTGVGKTQLVRSLAEFMFGSESALIKFDMSEYMEEHTMSKFIGSPPGYVGHEEDGQLTGKLRTNPFLVILFDEAEKAHPHIFDLFLQVFDDGRITDSKGRIVDVRNSIFVLTSNLNIEYDFGFGLGLANDENKFRHVAFEAAGKFFRREFLNRINDIIIFRSLNLDDVEKILTPILDQISYNLNKKYQVSLEIDEDARKLIARDGFNESLGVRELQRKVDELVNLPLSILVHNVDIEKNKKWRIMLVDGGLNVVF